MEIPDIMRGLSEPSVCVLLVIALTLASVAPAGWFVPAQSMAIASGALVSAGALSFSTTVGSLFGGAVLGSAIGYEVGRLLVDPTTRLLRRKDRLARAWAYSQRALRAHPALAVLVCRWNSALRACVPNVAGASGVSRLRFLGWSALGSAPWAPALVLVGVGIHRSVAGLQTMLAGVSAASLLVVTVLLVTGYRHWLSRETATERLDGGPDDRHCA